LKASAIRRGFSFGDAARSRISERLAEEGMAGASSPRRVVPGHDPLVLARYPAAEPRLGGRVVSLDAEPGLRPRPALSGQLVCGCRLTMRQVDQAAAMSMAEDEKIFVSSN
jgi:hypothetical protein